MIIFKYWSSPLLFNELLITCTGLSFLDRDHHRDRDRDRDPDPDPDRDQRSQQMFFMTIPSENEYFNHSYMNKASALAEFMNFP